MSRKKYWEDPGDPLTCTELCYKDEYLLIYDRENGEWREPTRMEEYLHFHRRQEKFRADDLQSRVNVLEERLKELGKKREE